MSNPGAKKATQSKRKIDKTSDETNTAVLLRKGRGKQKVDLEGPQRSLRSNTIEMNQYKDIPTPDNCVARAFKNVLDKELRQEAEQQRNNNATLIKNSKGATQGKKVKPGCSSKQTDDAAVANDYITNNNEESDNEVSIAGQREQAHDGVDLRVNASDDEFPDNTPEQDDRQQSSSDLDSRSSSDSDSDSESQTSSSDSEVEEARLE